MSEISFASLLQLKDEHLLELLKEIPNEVLLIAVAGEREKAVRQRVCEVLSINGAQVFMDDFARLPAVTNEQQIASQIVIVKIMYAHVSSGELEFSKLNTSRKLAS